MDGQKNFIIDTNILLDDPKALFKLRNGNENRVFIPYHVLLELNKFKNNPRWQPVVTRVVQGLIDHPDHFTVLKTDTSSKPFADLVDQSILEEIAGSGVSDPILVTNDKMLQLQATHQGIQSVGYAVSVSPKPEAERYTGFVSDREEAVANSFMWNDKGKPVFFGTEGEKIIDYQHRIWNVIPRTVYQNLALELLLNPAIPIVSIQSDAGYGKSFLALAAALYLTLERKAHEKIVIVKPMIEIGQKMGYLPGKISEKLEPYVRYITDLVMKLHKLRPANRIFASTDPPPAEFDPRRFELLPMTYIRGMNIENAVVIIDEMQNLSRAECRAILSRMGENVKCICLGDIHQVDAPSLNAETNGLNWVVRKFRGNRIYAHLVVKGDRSRGPITDLVIQSGL